MPQTSGWLVARDGREAFRGPSAHQGAKKALVVSLPFPGCAGCTLRDMRRSAKAENLRRLSGSGNASSAFDSMDLRFGAGAQGPSRGGKRNSSISGRQTLTNLRNRLLKASISVDVVDEHARARAIRDARTAP